MKIHVMTLFPEMIMAGVNSSILKKATEKKLLEIEAVNIRDYSTDKHKKVDDYPYGGGAGMLMQAQPIYDAYRAIIAGSTKKVRTVYLTPQGQPFHQKMAEDFAKEEELVFLCGHYEGIDERVLEEIVTDYVSIGDYVLTGGELPAMVMIDAIARLIPDVLHNDVSAETESFHRNLLEYPQYSRPEVWRDKVVPEVLLSGDHKKIVAWRLEESIKRTKERRPDLYEKYCHTEEILKAMKKQKRQFFHMAESLRSGRGEIVYEGKTPLSIAVYEKVSNELMAENIEREDYSLIYEKALERKDDSLREKLVIVTSDEELKDYLLQECGAQNASGDLLGCYTKKEAMYQKIKEVECFQKNGTQYMYGFRKGEHVLVWIVGECIGRIDSLYSLDCQKYEQELRSALAVAVNEALVNDLTPVVRIGAKMQDVIDIAKDAGVIFSEKILWRVTFPDSKKSE